MEDFEKYLKYDEIMKDICQICKDYEEPFHRAFDCKGNSDERPQIYLKKIMNKLFADIIVDKLF